MYFNSTTLLNTQLCQKYKQINGNSCCGPNRIDQFSSDEHDIDSKMSNLGPVITLHNCLNQQAKCTVENCALNIFDNVVVKEELIIDDYEDSESVIENYYYDSFEKWSEFGQPLKTFLQNSNFNYHIDENFLGDKMLEDTNSNNSSYDGSSNSLAESIDKTVLVRNQEWAIQKVFKCEKLAKSYLDSHNWSLRVRYNIQGGARSLYRCNLVKNKMPQCAAKVSMEYSKKTKRYVVYNNGRKHTHGTILLDQSRSDRNVREKVKELVDLGLSKYEIQLHLENNGYTLPSDNLVKKPEPEPVPLLVKPIEIKPKIEINHKIDSLTNATKWIMQKKFINSDFALQYMKQTGIWGICSKKRGRTADKLYYRCNRVRKTGPQCAAQKYLLIDHTTGGASLFGLNEHTHEWILSQKMNEPSIHGIRMRNIVIKQEPLSDNENDENYEYRGYENDELKVNIDESLHQKNRPSTLKWQNTSIKADSKNVDESKDRISPLSVDTNKDNFWILNRTFKTGALAKLYLDEHKIWKIEHRETNGIGLKCIYRCGLLVDTSSLEKCAALAYAQYHAKNDKVFFYTNSVEHTHKSIVKKDCDKKLNKIFRDHPKNNELNLHIKKELDDDVTDKKLDVLSDHETLNTKIELPISSDPAEDTAIKSPEIEETEDSSPKTKKRVLPWQLEKKFHKLKDAMLYMKNKPNWYMWKKQNFRHGGSSKSYFRCTVRIDNNHCYAQKHLFVDKANNTISISRYHEHSHEPTSPAPGSPIPFEDEKSPTIVKEDDTNKENLTEPINSEATQIKCSTKGTWGNNWALEKKFKNMTEAIPYMKNLEIWSICGKLKVVSGYRQYYRCNLVKKSGPQCEAKKYLFFNTPTKEVLLYGCNSHTHDLILAQRIKTEIEQHNGDEVETPNETPNETVVEDTEEKRYVIEKKFKNLDMAMAYLNEANTWTHHSDLKSTTGERRYYLCKLRGNNKSSMNCKARCCLSIKTGKQEVILYNRLISHKHQVPYKKLKRGPVKKLLQLRQAPDNTSMPRQYHSWHLERNFINSEFALKYMKKEKIWSIYSKRRTNNGNEVQYYRCNEVKKQGPQCAAQKYLVFHSNRAKVSLYGRNEHTHESILAGRIKTNEFQECDNVGNDDVGNNDVANDDVVTDGSHVVENNDDITVDQIGIEMHFMDPDRNYIEPEQDCTEPDPSYIEPESENVIDETDDEPLNENLYAVDVVIEEDETTSQLESPAVPQHERGRGLCKNYVLEKKFRSSKAALKHVKNERIWSVSFTGKNKTGYRQRFRCNMVGRKGPQCAARKYLVYDYMKGAQIFASIAEHTHDSILSNEMLPADDNPNYCNDTLSRVTAEQCNDMELNANIGNNESGSGGDSLKKPRQGWKRKLYSLERKFKNSNSATNYMKNQREWGLHSRTNRKHDRKQYYRCNFVKVGGPQCQAGKFLLYSNYKKEVSLFYCNNHTHDFILQNSPYNKNHNTEVEDDGSEIEPDNTNGNEDLVV